MKCELNGRIIISIISRVIIGVEMVICIPIAFVP